MHNRENIKKLLPIFFFIKFFQWKEKRKEIY